MKRFVTDGRNHPGLGSRMFRWATAHYGFIKVLAYVDRRWYGGELKEWMGFKPVGTSIPTMFYTDGHIRLHRRTHSRENLIEMIKSENHNRTKDSMMRDLGYYRIWDCGKLRLEWSAP